MKKFEDFTTEDLKSLRNEIVLNSLYIADYRNSFGIDAHSVCTFFDGYVDFIFELAEEDDKERDWQPFDVFDKYDNIDTLEEWYYCYDDFSWVEYEDEEE